MIPETNYIELVNKIDEAHGGIENRNWKTMDASLIKNIVIHRISLAYKGPDNPLPVGDLFLDAFNLGTRFQNPLLNTGGKVPYHFIVRPQGRVEQLLPIQARGAHSRGINWCSLGIACVGDFRKSPVPEEQWRSLVILCAILSPIVVSPFKEDCIIGHYQTPEPKPDCPGENLSISLLRQDVARIAGTHEILADECARILQNAGIQIGITNV